MATKRRTVENFPRMKNRRAGRRRRPRIDWARMTAAASAASVAFSGMASAVVKAMSQMEDAFARIQATTDATNRQMAAIALSSRASVETPTEVLNAFGRKEATRD